MSELNCGLWYPQPDGWVAHPFGGVHVPGVHAWEQPDGSLRWYIEVCSEAWDRWKGLQTQSIVVNTPTSPPPPPPPTPPPPSVPPPVPPPTQGLPTVPPQSPTPSPTGNSSETSKTPPSLPLTGLGNGQKEGDSGSGSLLLLLIAVLIASQS